jgi:RNA polymerase sigma-70 factor (ECF subfamily)
VEWIERNVDLLAEAQSAMDSANPDRGLLDQFRNGNRDAFTALYRLHDSAVFRFALNMSGDAAAAAEITQDVFVWLIRHPGKFDPDRADLGTFLAGVARKLLQRRRRLAFRWLPLRKTAAPDPGDAIDAASLHRAIGLLPSRYREAIVLCDLEGRSYEEAAAVVGCAVGTIRSRLHRGRDLLARKFRTRSHP